MKYRFSINDAMEFAEKSLGIPGWKAYSWESCRGGHLVTGCVPFGTYASGKFKGKPRFKHPKATSEERVIISDAELTKTAKEYENETCRCWNCKGEGRITKGWSRAEGHKYGRCKRCDGTGIAGGSQ